VPPSAARIAGIGRSTRSIPRATAGVTSSESGPSSETPSGGAEPASPLRTMSIKGYPVAGSPAVVRAVTPWCGRTSPWRAFVDTAGGLADELVVVSRPSWRNCATGEPVRATTAESCAGILPVFLPDGSTVCSGVFGVIPSVARASGRVQYAGQRRSSSPRRTGPEGTERTP
jgi:hypothetical protein